MTKERRVGARGSEVIPPHNAMVGEPGIFPGRNDQNNPCYVQSVNLLDCEAANIFVFLDENRISSMMAISVNRPTFGMADFASLVS